MSVVSSVVRKELLELRYNKGTLMSIAVFAVIFSFLSPMGGSELGVVYLSTLLGMYAAFGISGQAFNSEKRTGTLETVFCGPAELRELWFGKILGTLVPSLVVAYAVAGLVVAGASARSAVVEIGLPVAIYMVAILPALVASFIGIMGFIQLNFDARVTRMLSVAALVLIVSLMSASMALPQDGSLMSWQTVGVLGLVAALLMTLPALLVNRLSKERIVLTSEV